MKPYRWNLEKNILLKSERGICFEDIVDALADQRFLDVIAHPNQNKYQGQRVFIVAYRGYAYAVPFVETDEHIFLKTIIPSRRYTKKYLSQ